MPFFRGDVECGKDAAFASFWFFQEERNAPVMSVFGSCFDGLLSELSEGVFVGHEFFYFFEVSFLSGFDNRMHGRLLMAMGLSSNRLDGFSL